MARSFSTNDYLQVNATPINGTSPWTLNCWFNSTDLTTLQTLMFVGKSSVGDSYGILRLGGTLAGDPLQYIRREGGQNIANTTTSYSTSTWQMATGVQSATNAIAYLDAGGKTSVSSTAAVTDYNRIGIGASRDSSPGQYLNGSVAEAAIWNVALTDDDVATLYNGGVAIPAWAVRPDALVFYAPLFNADGDIDWAGDGTYDLTNSGAGYSGHVQTTLWLPSPAVLFTAAAAGGPTIVTPSALVLNSSIPTPTPDVNPFGTGEVAIQGLTTLPLLAHTKVVTHLPAALDLDSSIPAPTVDITGAVVVIPSALDLVSSIPAVADLEVRQLVSAQLLASSIPATTQIITHLPATLDLASSIPSPTVSTPGAFSPPAQDLSSAVQAPSISAGATIASGPLDLASAVQDPTPANSLPVSVLTVTVSEQAPTIQAGNFAIPTTLDLASSIPTPDYVLIKPVSTLDLTSNVFGVVIADELSVSAGVQTITSSIPATTSEVRYKDTVVLVLSSNLLEPTFVVDAIFAFGVAVFTTEDTWLALLGNRNMLIVSRDYINIPVTLIQNGTANYNLVTGSTVKASLITPSTREIQVAAVTLIENTHWTAGGNSVTAEFPATGTDLSGNDIDKTPVILEVQVTPPTGETRTFFSENIAVLQDTIA